jgi:hypothetical protein
MPGFYAGHPRLFSCQTWIAGTNPAMTFPETIPFFVLIPNRADNPLGRRYINGARHVRAFGVGMEKT